jgi:peptidoglycan-associated lipoprotein
MIRRLSLLAFVFSPLLFSCQTARLSDAVERQERGEFYDAAQIYRKVYSKTPSSRKHLRGSIAFHMAECFREINQPNFALSGYANAIRYQYEDSSAILRRAQMLHRLGRYPEAILSYQAFLEIAPRSIPAKNGQTGCELALEWRKNPSRYVVKKMDKLNSRDGEFSPVLFGETFNELYFSSSRKEALGEKSAITGTKNNDFFIVQQNEKKQWLKPEHLESGINTEWDEGTASFSPDGSRMYYTHCPQDSASSQTAAIYESTRSGAAWSAGQKLEIFKDSSIMAAHPSIGVDGYLYFVSDVAGGYGGKDLWRVPLASIGSYYPENLGPEINTSGNEEFPLMRADSVLYFSSDGHPGMGGLDIFKAVRHQEQWRIENMKPPINSMADDFGLTFAGKNENGYFSSNRNDGRGADHLYSFDLPGAYIWVEGWVLNREEMEIDSATVRIVGKDGSNQRLFVRADATYSMEVRRGVDYVMMASAPGYLNQKQTLSVPDEERSETHYVDFYLHSVSKPALIEDVFYDFNRASLRAESKAALDELILLLQDNPNVTIELSAHTDRIGSDSYNDNLSQRRAQSVVDYLIANGVAHDRLTAKGYGKSQPTTVSRNIREKHDFLPEGQELTPDFIQTLEPIQQAIADQINRRTEFRVLSTHYGLR